MMRIIDLLLFIVVIWGPIKIFPTDSLRTPESALMMEFDTNSIVEITLWIFVGLRVFLYISYRMLKKKRPIGNIPIKGALLWMFIYSFICFATAIYSPGPWLTLFRAYQLITGVLFLTIVISKEKYEGYYLNVLIVFYIIKALYNFVMYFASPFVVGYGGYTGPYRLAGGFPFNPDFGFAGTFVIIYTLYELFLDNKKFLKGFVYTCLFLLGWALVLLSWTRSTIFATMLILVISPFFIKSKRYNFILGFFVFVIVSILSAFPSIRQDVISFIVREPETFKNLSFRVETWENLKGPIIARPFLGYGFVTGSRVLLRDWWGSGLNIGDAHNAWVEALVSVGIIGTVPLMLVVILTIKNLLKTEMKMRFILISLMVSTLATSFVSTGIERFSPVFSIIIVYAHIYSTVGRMSETNTLKGGRNENKCNHTRLQL